jgi:hypothetical protein
MYMAERDGFSILSDKTPVIIDCLRYCRAVVVLFAIILAWMAKQ